MRTVEVLAFCSWSMCSMMNSSSALTLMGEISYGSAGTCALPGPKDSSLHAGLAPVDCFSFSFHQGFEVIMHISGNGDRRKAHKGTLPVRCSAERLVTMSGGGAGHGKRAGRELPPQTSWP